MRRSPALLLAAVVTIAACGDDGASATDPTTAPATTTVVAVTTAPTTTTIAPTTVAPTTSAPPATSTPTTTIAADDLTGGIEGVAVYEGLSGEHTTEDVVYDPMPPVGGPHAAEWVQCGPYDTEVDEEEAAHSLEHGAVWITYDASALAPTDVSALLGIVIATFQDDTDRLNWVLVSPYPDMPSPLIASAWGRQLVLDGITDPRLPQFLLYFANGPQNPEPGAPC